MLAKGTKRQKNTTKKICKKILVNGATATKNGFQQGLSLSRAAYHYTPKKRGTFVLTRCCCTCRVTCTCDFVLVLIFPVDRVFGLVAVWLVRMICVPVFICVFSLNCFFAQRIDCCSNLILQLFVVYCSSWFGCFVPRVLDLDDSYRAPCIFDSHVMMMMTTC